MSVAAQLVVEQAILVARIRGRIPKRVHVLGHYHQGISTFEWNQESGQYVELISKEEIDNEYRKPVRTPNTRSRLAGS